MKKQFNLAFLGILAILLLTGCADNTLPSECVSCHVYGFCGGFWHGMIMAWDLVAMIFWDDVAVYAPNNNGGWYAFGFVFGSGSLAVLIKHVNLALRG